MSWFAILAVATWIAEASVAVVAGALAFRSATKGPWLLVAGGMAAVVALQAGASLSGAAVPDAFWPAIHLGFAGLAAAGFALTMRRDTAGLRARAALELGEKKLRFLLDRVSEAYLISEAGRISFASRAFQPIFGVDAGAAIGAQFEAFVLPSSLHAYRHRYGGRPTSMGVHRIELEVSHARGEQRWVEASFQVTTWDGRPAELVCVSDITDRRRAEDALRESEERYRGLVEQAVIGIYRTTPDGTVLMANPALAAMLGEASSEELVGRDLRKWTGAEAEPRTAFNARLEREGVVSGFESTWVRHDGVRMSVRESARVVRNERGETEFCEGTVEDLTEHQELERQLVQAQKMEAVGRLAGGVAHDFNNLLQAILNTVHLARVGASDAKSGETRLAEIEEYVGRGAQLARQLLLFARRGPSQFESLDLNEVVDGAGRLLRRLLREDVALRVELAPGPVRALADRVQLEQVIVNLALNGADAMPEGGTLMVSTARRSDDGACLNVKDTGHGIPERIRDRIFEPFFSTKPSDRGSGIGLSVVHGIVTRHGGSIEVESAEGQGTTFRITLPAPTDSERLTAPSHRPRPGEELGGRGEAILVVEDQELVRESLSEILIAAGYEVAAAASAEEALPLAESGTFQLLLSDLVLPGMSGSALAAALRQRQPQLRVIIMSGHTDGLSPDQPLGAAGNAFLQKPFDAQTLTRSVRGALDRR